jgi:hypothetical protein
MQYPDNSTGVCTVALVAHALFAKRPPGNIVESFTPTVRDTSLLSNVKEQSSLLKFAPFSIVSSMPLLASVALIVDTALPFAVAVMLPELVTVNCELK